MKVTAAYCLFGIIYLLMVILIYKKSGIKEKPLNYQLIVFILYFIAVFLRVYKFNVLPGMDADEAMGAINSWSLGKWGIDYFNLTKHPVYLYAWGSGMNILYPALTIPFVKIIGLNMIAYRSPLIILNIFAIGAVIFALIRSKYAKKKVLLFIMIIFLTPITIVNCRWAVESNLFPTIFYLAFATFLLYDSSVGSSKKLYWTILNLLIAVSAYAYSNNWIFLGLFVFLFLLWQFNNREINTKTLCLTLCTYVIIEIPLILFLYVNYVGKKSISLLNITIPKLTATRSVFVDLNIHSIVTNIENAINILWSGCDYRPKMGLNGLGAFLPFMVTFALIGLIILVCKGKDKSNVDKFILIMLISLIPNIVFIEASWLHMNALILPVLYCEVIGINRAFNSRREFAILLTIFAIFLAMYCKEYMKDNTEAFNNYFNTTSTELGNMLVKENNKDKVYLYADGNFNNTNVGSMYVLPIYYNKINPWSFKKSAKIIKQGEWRSTYDFGKWHIRYSPQFNKNKKNDTGAVYIIQNGTVSAKKLAHYHKISEGDYYTIYK